MLDPLLPDVLPDAPSRNDVVVAMAVHAVLHDLIDRLRRLVGVPKEVQEPLTRFQGAVGPGNHVHDAVVLLHHVHGDAPVENGACGRRRFALRYRPSPGDVAHVLALNSRQVQRPNKSAGAVCCDTAWVSRFRMVSTFLSPLLAISVTSLQY